MAFLDLNGLIRFKDRLFGLRGVANGFATLDETAKVPLNQLPVMEGASTTNNGVSGTIIAPSAGQENYLLSGDGTWNPQKATCFAACSTAGSEAQKDAVSETEVAALYPGLRVVVTFSEANTATNPKLKLNTLASKNIFYDGVRITSGNNKGFINGTCDFIYDGTQWHLVGNYSKFSFSETVLSIEG